MDSDRTSGDRPPVRMEGSLFGVKRASTHITEGGGLIIPEEFLREMGVGPGGKVLLRLADGVLCVFSVATGIRQAQEIARRNTPPGRSLADELIAERHAEAERE